MNERKKENKVKKADTEIKNIHQLRNDDDCCYPGKSVSQRLIVHVEVLNHSHQFFSKLKKI